MMLEFGVITIFPEIFDCLQYGITGRALENQLVSLQAWNPRKWSKSESGRIDDRPYGGGPGMVMMYEPLLLAIKEAKSTLQNKVKTVYLSPQGKTVDQQMLRRHVEANQSILFIAGRYEGIDERLFNHIDEEWSLGDFVMSGGEIAAAAFIDAMIRLVPGAVNDERSIAQDSFAADILDHPHYTRPAQTDGHAVPEILLSGSHQAIAIWRRQNALGKTWLKKPDLLKKLDLSHEDQLLLTEFKQKYGLQLQAMTSFKE